MIAKLLARARSSGLLQGSAWILVGLAIQALLGFVFWLLGARVHGGRMHGDWPGLGEAARWQGRDLAVSTDFRTVLWRALGAHFALDDAALARVLPGFKFPAGALDGLTG